ncbi:MAG: ABC transporter ATP-binding protein [Armatimonadetes bacterium]|nr:ABC transporter ATP-binding protein [Armatimonadota bacterium]
MRPAGDKAPAFQKPDKEIVRRVVGLFKPHQGKVWSVVVTVLISVVIGIAPSFLIQDVVDQGFLKQDFNRITVDFVLIFVTVVAASASTAAYGYLGVVMGQAVMMELRDKLYQHLQGMSLKFFTNARTGDIQTRLISDVAGVQEVLSNTLTDQLSNIAIFIGAIVAMAYLDWRLTLVSVVLLPFFGIAGKYVGDFARKVRTGTQEQTSELNSMMQETLSVSGVLLSKTAGNQDVLIKRFSDENRKLADWQIKLYSIQYIFFGLIRLITQAAPALLYVVGGYFMIKQGDKSMTLGKIFALNGLQIRMFFPMTGLVGAQVQIMSSFALFQRIFEYLDMPRDIQEKPDAVAVEPRSVYGEVAFENVYFKYEDDQENWTLNNISFKAEPGQLVALVGPSGAGKTTVTYLIPRLYDAMEGRVTLDGRDIRDLSLDSLGQIVGAVTQETYLMHTTVRENLKVAKTDATDDELVAACQAANIWDHVNSLPEGLDTIVGERGYKFSGGEKQRIGIARAILKNPRILILDEATSALDTQSERIVQNSLNSLMDNRTTFAIAHRLSTILRADLILVVEAGRVVEAGKHSELLAKNGLYRQLYEEQFRDEDRDQETVPVG